MKILSLRQATLFYILLSLPGVCLGALFYGELTGQIPRGNVFPGLVRSAIPYTIIAIPLALLLKPLAQKNRRKPLYGMAILFFGVGFSIYALKLQYAGNFYYYEYQSFYSWLFGICWGLFVLWLTAALLTNRPAQPETDIPSPAKSTLWAICLSLGASATGSAIHFVFLEGIVAAPIWLLLILLLLGLLALMPPIGTLLNRLHQSQLGNFLKWVGTLFYIGILGLLIPYALLSLVWLWCLILPLLAIVLGTLVGFNRGFWESRMAGVTRWQRWLSLLTLSAFLLLLAANWLQLVPAADALNLLLVGLFGGLLVLGCVQLPLVRSGHPMDRAGAVVFPGIGLLFLLTMLAV